MSFLRAGMLFVHQDRRACATAHISISPVNEDDQEDTACMHNSLKNYKMWREVGGGIGMGNTCKPMAVSFQCMTKFTTNKKKNKK